MSDTDEAAKAGSRAGRSALDPRRNASGPISRPKASTAR